MDFTPGIFAQQRNGAETARLSIRGYGVGRQFQGGGLLLLLDGVPLNTADGSFDFQAVDPWLIDYVTVYQGSNGMTLGGSTLGGVINLGTTVPDSNGINQLHLATGSFDTKRAQSTFTTDTTGVNDVFRLRASHFSQVGFRKQNQQNSNLFDLQIVTITNLNLQQRWSRDQMTALSFIGGDSLTQQR